MTNYLSEYVLIKGRGTVGFFFRGKRVEVPLEIRDSDNYVILIVTKKHVRPETRYVRSQQSWHCKGGYKRGMEVPSKAL